MKKKTGFCFLLVFITSTLPAQLTDTKWRNSMNIPDPMETFLQFKKDTVLLTIVADGTLVETMTYSVSKDTLRLTKTSGMSPCADNIIGLYHFELKDDKLTITPLSDDCSERAGAFKPEAWSKEKI